MVYLQLSAPELVQIHPNLYRLVLNKQIITFYDNLGSLKKQTPGKKANPSTMPLACRF